MYNIMVHKARQWVLKYVTFKLEDFKRSFAHVLQVNMKSSAVGIHSVMCCL